ncbi:MAG TPA: hypothetical protein PKX93_03255 [bacterium]|nr:hypothetical protein [bacterium]
MMAFVWLLFLIFVPGLPAGPVGHQPTAAAYAIILKKNVFTGSLPSATKSPPVANPVTPLNEPEPPDKGFALLGTAVSTSRPVESLAVFTNLRSKEELFCRAGEKLGETTIVRIEEKGVLLENALGDQYFFTTAGLRPLKTVPRTSFYRLNLKECLKNLQEDKDLLTSLSVTPEEEGFKISGITAGCLLERAGLTSNDLIKQVNQKKLRSAEEALKIYEEILKSGQKKVVIEGLREKRPLRLVYYLE